MFRLFSVLLLLAAGPVSADTTLVFLNETGGEREAGRMEISDGNLRFDSGAGDQSVRMLYKANADEVVVVDDDRKSYMVIDKATLDKLAGMHERMMAQMEAQMAQLPAAQREQMKQMMQNMGGGQMAPPEPRRFERTGTTDEVAGYTCEELIIWSGDEVAARQCVVDAASLEMPDEDFQTLRAMQDFMADMVSSFSQMQDQVFEFGDPARQEIPVRYVHHSRFGDSSGELDSVSFDAVDPARFEIPRGYKQEQMPDLEQL